MIQTCKWKYSLGLTTAVLFGLLLALAVMGGCTTAKGTDLAERSESLVAARRSGFTFDDTLMSTEYGNSPSQVVITGPIGGPRILDDSAKNGDRIIEYTRVVLDKIEGKWVLSFAAKREGRKWYHLFASSQNK